MTDNHFIEKFKSKSDRELERVAMDSKSFVFDARYAAITLLKDRNYDSDIINQVEKEYENLVKAQQKTTEDLKEQDQRLIRRIRQIPIKKTGKYGLKNGNELQVRRLNQDYFQIRIEAFRSELAPVMICRVKDDSTYSCYPFLYLKSILIFGFGGTALTVILAYLGYVENEIFIFSLPLFVTIGFQLLLMPFIYFIILNFFRKRLRKK
ncbi:hypothetical protein Aoki45_32550 [Algoriphagus sp. oki45]|uniref:hypothetical protein n=1 Tax=Algoriphagus sp. oki45 TaxID=3067294 RepID=UPI0027EAE243|nr:hypothetical protein Aoki45_32550 [Algoriphagus sp. oki45]